MDLNTINLVNYALGAGMIIGVVNIVKVGLSEVVMRASIRSLLLALSALVTGMLFGALHWFGFPTLEVGLGIALMSSGLYEISQRVGGN